MISVRCPACGKLMGFEESDAGSLIACPLCRQSFFIPPLARPADPEAAPNSPAAGTEAPPVVPPLPLEPTLPDEIGLAPDPDLEPVPEELEPVPDSEVLPAEEEAPPPEAAPSTYVMPRLELDPPPQPAEAPPPVEPTAVAPSLSAAASLSGAVPPEERQPERPIDVLEEVDEEEEDERPDEPDEDKEEDRRRPKRDDLYDRPPYRPRPRRAEEVWTRNRILGGVGAATGGLILIGTLAHHLTASETAWHYGACCGDLFGLTLFGAGLFFLIRG